ncbi:MAG TPA: chemotaxis-specific protein-glutamate methyltransferase CheB [Planctomycetota bacterium]|nr:chemotaxis-specific protein-glutamate methyltransferase CheB [Planctomycetota bacterium]
MSAEAHAAKRHRVLVVDDSAVVRRLLVEALSAEPAIEVVGAAHNGREALELFESLAPELVTLDVEMPELDGLAVLREIRRRAPCLPVVMFSTQTAKGTQTTLAALLAGASDFVHKPTSARGAPDARHEIQRLLVPRILALCERAAGLSKTAIRPLAELAPHPIAPRLGDTTVFTPSFRQSLIPAEVVAIGVSTGGPAALAQLLEALGPEPCAPILIVQHMPPVYTRHLAESLARKTSLDVREAVSGDRLTRGSCLIAPGDHHMLVERCAGGSRVVLNQAAAENSCRPSVDVLFREVAAVFQARALALVLTGMGQDGLLGSRAVRAGGGVILAQDEASSVVWGMPGFVVRDGLADRVLDLEGLAREIRLRTRPNPLARAS